jgi:hypothetical protein
MVLIVKRRLNLLLKKSEFKKSALTGFFCANLKNIAIAIAIIKLCDFIKLFHELNKSILSLK